MAEQSTPPSGTTRPQQNGTKTGNGGYDASAITVLEGLEAVRKRPGMYIGSTGERGLHHLVYEVVDNSVDEALAGYCDHIEVTLRADGAVQRRRQRSRHPRRDPPDRGPADRRGRHDDPARGRQVRRRRATRSPAVCTASASPWSTRCPPASRPWSSATVSRGSRTSPTAASRWASCRRASRPTRRGTSQTFWADGSIFETDDYDFETLRSRLQQYAFLNKGLQISLTDERPAHLGTGDEVAGSADELAEGEAAPFRSVVYKYDEGLADYVRHLNGAKKVEVVHPDIIDFESEDTERRLSLEIAMQWTNAYSESVHTYANTISTTEGGTHEEGFRAAMTSLINRYARDKGILKEKDENLTGDDIREGLTAVISIKLGEPQFEGQTKTKLGNTEAKTFVQKVVNDQLGDWLDSHPTEARDVIRKSIQASAARMAARKAREATRRKGLLESGGMPGKLRDCQSNHPDECEVFIVEGDSAGGSAVRGRNPRTQAILPIRGKILNVERARLDRALGNQEVQALITAFGTGIGEDFDLTQAQVPQDRADGRRRRRRPAHPDPAAHPAVPLHAGPDHARARLHGAAAAVPDQVVQRRPRLRVHGP